jgi:glycosyltransferase involved in cell wall biosynthesis
MKDAQAHGDRVNASGGRSPIALIVTPRYLPLLGGMERECQLLATAFAARGYAPLVLTEGLGQGLPRRERSGPIRVLRVPSSERRTLAVQLWVALVQALVLVLLRRRAAFAVVRTMTLPTLVVGLLKRLRLIRFPTLATAETGGEADDVVALARRPLFPVSRALADAHDALNGICGFNVDHLREHGFAADRITEIPNGIDTSAWAAARAPETVRRLLFLGRLDREKGLFELLEAFGVLRERHPDVTLTFAGDGPERPRLEAQAPDGVTFLGRVAYEEVGALLDAHDCLVLPSYSEGMPLSVLEAAVHRRFIVATDVGDLRRLLGDRARLVAPRDVAALRHALEDLVAADRPSPPDYAALVALVSIDAVADAMLRRLGVA